MNIHHSFGRVCLRWVCSLVVGIVRRLRLQLLFALVYLQFIRTLRRRLLCWLFIFPLFCTVLLGHSIAVAYAQSECDDPNTPEHEQCTPTPTREPLFKTPTPAPTNDYTCPDGYPEGYGSQTPSALWSMNCGQCIFGAQSTQMSATATAGVPTSTPDPNMTPTPVVTPTVQPTPAGFCMLEYYGSDNGIWIVSDGVDEYGRGFKQIEVWNDGEDYVRSLWLINSPNLVDLPTSMDVSYEYYVAEASSNAKMGMARASTFFPVSPDLSAGATAKTLINFLGQSMFLTPGRQDVIPGQAAYFVMQHQGGAIQHSVTYLYEIIYNPNGANKTLWNAECDLGFLPTPTPTPEPTGVPGYCAVIDGVLPNQDNDFFGDIMPVPSLGDAQCTVVMPAFAADLSGLSWLPGMPDMPDIDFPGLQVCFRDISFGQIHLLGMTLDMDMLALYMAGAFLFRLLMRS